MYGAIVQLGYLAQYSRQLFSDLIDEARSHEDRIKALTQRTKNLVDVVQATTIGNSAPPNLQIGEFSEDNDGIRPAVPINGLFTQASQPSAIRAR